MIQTNLVRVSYGSNQGLSGPRFKFFLGYELLKVYSKINTLPNSIQIIRSLGQISQTGNRKKVFPGQKNTSDLLQNISLCIYLHLYRCTFYIVLLTCKNTRAFVCLLSSQGDPIARNKIAWPMFSAPTFLHERAA